MAITITKIAGEPNSSSEMQLLIDTEADIENLPTLDKRMSGDENGYKK